MTDARERYRAAEARMSAREASDVIGFLFTLDYFDPPGDVTVGRRLFTEKKCFACHRVGEYGGDAGPSLDIAAATDLLSSSPQLCGTTAR
jgi:mono/diheme cytochrome c family protein